MITPPRVDPFATPSGTAPSKPSKTAGKTIDPYAAVTGTTTPMPNPYASPAPESQRATPTAAANTVVPPRIALANQSSIQGLMAVAHLDGWLLTDNLGQNPIAQELVFGTSPSAVPTQPWFYYVPQKGEPSLLCYASDCNLFTVVGKRLPYTGYREVATALKATLKGKLTIATEYSPNATLPTISRLDAGSAELLRSMGITLRSSETLVQYTRAMWGPEGLASHLVAAHHLQELRKEAFATISGRMRAGLTLTELDLQQQLQRSMKMRGIVGPAPVVAFAAHTAYPTYRVTTQSSATLQRGDLILLSLAGRVDKPDTVYAALTGVAVADDKVAPAIARAFNAATAARDEALAVLADRKNTRSGLKGFEVDARVRTLLEQSGLGKNIEHACGHSLDTSLYGHGTDLEDTLMHDNRTILTGTGFALGPGLYFHGEQEFGVRTEVSVFVTATGIQVTTAPQDTIELLLK
jgi:Xaa-Pro aminopeptidase